MWLSRRNSYKVLLSSEEVRRRRVKNMAEIRKTNREENLIKKRRSLHLHQESSSESVQCTDLDDKKLERLTSKDTGVWSTDQNLQLEATTQFHEWLSNGNSSPIGKVIESGVVPRFVQFVMLWDSPDLQFEATWALANIASGTSENIQAVIDSGAVPCFVNLLSSRDDRVCELAVRALGNIASGTSEHTKVVIDHEAVPALVHLLRSSNDHVCELALWALGNIAGASPNFRDRIIESEEAGMIQLLLKLVEEKSKLSMLRNAAWTLSNLKPQTAIVEVGEAMPALVRLIGSDDLDTLTDACWSLAYLTNDTDSLQIQDVIEAGVCEQLIELLRHPSPSVFVPALFAVGNIAACNASHQYIMEHGGVQHLLGIFNHSHEESIKSEASWIISDIILGNNETIQAILQALLNAGLLAPMINQLENDDLAFKKKAAWAISYFTSIGSVDQIKYLVRRNCIKPLVDNLVCRDAETVSVCLEALDNILKVGEAEKHKSGGVNYCTQLMQDADGYERLDQLQVYAMHTDRDIFDRCIRMQRTYWIDYESEHEVDQPLRAAGDVDNPPN